MAGRAQKSKGVIFLFSWFHSNQLLAFKCFMERKYQGWAQIWGLFEGMNVSHWVISQGEWSTVGQCEEAKRGFVILYGLWDTAKCLSRDTLGHFCSTNKWDTHTHGHAYIHKCTDTHNSRNPTASSLVILICYSDGVLLWTPSWQTKLESKRGTEGGRKGRGKQTKKKPSPFSAPPAVIGWWHRVFYFLFANWPPRHWLWREFYPKTRACLSVPWNTLWLFSTHLAI